MSKEDQAMKKQGSSSSEEFVPSQAIGGTTPLGVKTRSKTQDLTVTSQPIPAQPSEQIKLALSVDENGNILLKSISGRPPSIASSERQGLHTVAWATYESMIESAINGHKPGTAFANIIALSDSLLGQEFTSSLIEMGYINLQEFQKWHDEFEVINQNEELKANIKKYAINGKLAEIFPVMENAIKAILTNQNLQRGAAYAIAGNIPSSKDEGSKIKTAIDALANLEQDLDQSNREAKQKPIIKNIAKEASNLFHYPYVDKQQQISDEQKQELIRTKEYRSLRSFRDNDVNLLAVQLSNLLGVVYSQYSGIIGKPGDKKYLQITEAIVNEIVSSGNWQNAVKVWHQKENSQIQANSNSATNAISFLVERVDSMLHTNPKCIGLFEGADSEQLTKASSSHHSESEGESESTTKPNIATTSQTQEIDIDKKIVIERLQELVSNYREDDQITTISEKQLTKTLDSLKQNCIEQQREQRKSTRAL
jgi:hypothetical protein